MKEFIIEQTVELEQFGNVWKKFEPKKELVRCRNCIHRPKKPDDYDNPFDLDFPDYECPCQCDDGFYSWYPNDDWFCANGKEKDT